MGDPAASATRGPLATGGHPSHPLADSFGTCRKGLFSYRRARPLGRHTTRQPRESGPPGRWAFVALARHSAFGSGLSVSWAGRVRQRAAVLHRRGGRPPRGRVCVVHSAGASALAHCIALHCAISEPERPAALPAACALCGLANPSFSQGSIAANASGASGVVAW